MTHFFRQWYVAPIFLVVFGIFIFAPFLFFGKVSPGNEQIGFYYALTHFTGDALREGTSLEWNGGNYGGVSATFDQFASAFNPLHRVLFHIFSSAFDVEHVSITISTCAGLLLAYWFGRRQKWLRASSILLALSYFSAVTFGWLVVGTLPSAAFAVCPGLLLCLHYASHEKDIRRYGLIICAGALLMGFGFLAGFMQFLLYNTSVAGLYALFLDWEKKMHTKRWYQHIQTFSALIGMVALGLLVGIKQWLPSTALLSLSVRSETFAIQNAEIPSFTYLVGYILPPYLEVPYLGGGAGEGFYIGACALLAAILGLIFYRTRTKVFFAAVYALMFALAFHAPILSWLNEHISPFSHMSGNLRWLSAGAFPLAYLGAAGIEGILRDPARISMRAQKITLNITASIAALLLLGSIGLRALVYYLSVSLKAQEFIIQLHTHGRTLTHDTSYYSAVLISTLQSFSNLFSLENPRFLFGLLCWIVAWVVYVCLFTFKSQELRSSVITLSVLITTAGIVALQWSSLIPRSIYTQTPALSQYLLERENDPHSFRVLGLLVGDGLYSKYFYNHQVSVLDASVINREVLSNDANLIYGVDSMSGLRPYQTMRMNQLLGTVVGYEISAYVFDPAKVSEHTLMRNLYNTDTERQVSIDEKLSDLMQKLPLLSMMNVKYLYSLYELQAAGLEKLTTITIPVENGIPMYVYENTMALPRVYFPKSIDFAEGSDVSVLVKVASVRDFREKSVIECVDCHQTTAKVATSTTVVYENGHIEIDTNTTSQAWLVVSESWSPFWSAKIDGEETSLYKANHIFQGILVPQGEHHIELHYSDPTVLELLGR